VNCIEPHPTAPIIATSGLDDNVKIWVPSADQWPQTLKGIKQVCSECFKESDLYFYIIQYLAHLFKR